MLEHFRTKSRKKSPKKYECDICLYTSSKESDLIKHFNTRKHKNNVKLNDLEQNGEKVAKNSPNMYYCNCGKGYLARNSLWYHKKKCLDHQDDETQLSSTKQVNEVDKELLVKLLLKNQDVMEKMVELMPHLGNQANNTNSFNTQNFNIQMFLNEHCKNAMNLTDFIDSLPITNETYDDTIENGLTNTITTMVINGLNEMDVLERPIHCTDSKRKTLYVKEDNKWEKDTELNLILQGIKQIALKQRINICKWQDANDGWSTDENLQTKLTNLVFNSMTTIENDKRETNKIYLPIV
jgi:hypothetical protein